MAEMHACTRRAAEEGVCLVCGEPLGPAPVSCPRCETLHHFDCWEYNGGCATFGCRRFLSNPSPRAEVDVPESAEPSLTLVQRLSALVVAASATAIWAIVCLAPFVYACADFGLSVEASRRIVFYGWCLFFLGFVVAVIRRGRRFPSYFENRVGAGLQDFDQTTVRSATSWGGLSLLFLATYLPYFAIDSVIAALRPS